MTRADTGAPLAGVAVRAFDGFGGPPAETVTESDGSYFLARSAGTYYLRTESTGFIDEVYDGVLCPFYSFCDPTSGTQIIVATGAHGTPRLGGHLGDQLAQGRGRADRTTRSPCPTPGTRVSGESKHGGYARMGEQCPLGPAKAGAARSLARRAS